LSKDAHYSQPRSRNASKQRASGEAIGAHAHKDDRISCPGGHLSCEKVHQSRVQIEGIESFQQQLRVAIEESHEAEAINEMIGV